MGSIHAANSAFFFWKFPSKVLLWFAKICVPNWWVKSNVTFNIHLSFFFWCFRWTHGHGKPLTSQVACSAGETIMTLFQSTTAGLDWREVSWSLNQVIFFRFVDVFCASRCIWCIIIYYYICNWSLMTNLECISSSVSTWHVRSYLTGWLMTSNDIVCSQGPGLKKNVFQNAGCTTCLKPVVFACLFGNFSWKFATPRPSRSCVKVGVLVGGRYVGKREWNITNITTSLKPPNPPP